MRAVVVVVWGAAVAGCGALAGKQASHSTIPAGGATSPAGCTLAPDDSGWLTAAVRAWEDTRERMLQLPKEPIPPLVLFDRRCVFHVAVGDTDRVSGTEHGGSIQLPDGRSIRPHGVGMTGSAFRDSSMFLVLALREVWRTDPRYASSRDNWQVYLTGAFIHEMTHVLTLPSLLPRIRGFAPDIYPDTIGDDVVQDRFGADAAFAASVRRETELLFRAVSARSPAARLTLAREALALMRARRERFYVGDLSSWAEIEQLFLDLEGVAQWTAFMHARTTAHRRLTFGDALHRFRAGEQYWSQDQGLALFLLLDAFDEAWRSNVFAETPVASLDLLARAIERRR